MAVVGDAYIIVRALTDKVAGDIRDGFKDVDKIGESAGRDISKGLSKGVKGNDVGGKITENLKSMDAAAIAAARGFTSLQRSGFTVQAALGILVGGISAVIGGLGAFGGSLLGAAGSAAVLGNSIFALVGGMVAAKMALGGVGKALGALKKGSAGVAKDTSAIDAAERALSLTIESNREKLLNANNAVRKAQLELNDAIREGQEEIQQLGFAAEQAALDEENAALTLEKARETLARVQDLPPNSRARKEAELAFQEAELNLRRAKDKSSDLNKEQDRLAKTGVAGTEAVIRATNALAEAEAEKARVVRDALRDQTRAEEDLARAKAATAAAGGGGNPFEGLNEFQISFVKFLQEVGPRFAGIKVAASAAFLPPLQEAITLVADRLIPTLEKGMGVLGAGMGSAAVSIAQAVTDGKNMENLLKVFESSGRILATAGSALGNLWGAILSILQVTAPIAERFFSFLEKKFGTFDKYLKSIEGNKAMTEFFALSADAAAQFGGIFGNIFSGIGNIITANLGPGTGGQYLLDWLTTATKKFEDLGATAEGKADLKAYFKGAAENTQAVMSAIGALLTEFIKLGDMPEIKKTWDTLGEGAPALGRVLAEAVKMGPIFAQLVKAVTELLAAFADSGQPIAFFATLTFLAEGLAAIFNNKLVQAVLNFVGPLLGIISAIGLVAKMWNKAMIIMNGYLLILKGSWEKFSQSLARNVILVVLGAIVFALISLYKNNEKFAAAVNQMFAALQTAFAPLMEIFAKVAEAIGKAMSAGSTSALDGIVNFLIMIVNTITTIINSLAASGVFEQIATVIQSVIGVVVDLFQSLVDSGVFQMIMDLVMEVFGTIGQIVQQLVDSGVFTLLIDAFSQIATMLGGALLQILPMLADAFMQIIQAVMPLVQMLMTSLVPVLLNLAMALVPIIITIVQALIPAFLKIIEAVLPLVTMLIDLLLPVIMQLIDAFMPLITMFIELLVPILATLIEAFMPIITLLIDLLVPVLTVLINIFTGVVEVIMFVVKTVIDFLLPIITFLIEGFTKFIEFIPQIGKVFEDVWNNIVNFFKGIINWIIGLMEGMINGIIDAINGFTAPLRDAIGAVAEFFGGEVEIGIIPKISLARLAKGGVVPATPGGTLAQIGEAGRPERVEPLDANGMSKRDRYMVDLINKQGTSAPSGAPINITVNPAAGMNERELASLVSRELAFQMRKGAAY
jgi:phage-related protein